MVMRGKGRVSNLEGGGGGSRQLLTAVNRAHSSHHDTLQEAMNSCTSTPKVNETGIVIFFF